MALTANTDWVTQDVSGLGTKAMVVLSAAVIYNGALCSHDTTAGEIKPYDGTDTDRLVGWHFGDAVTGNASGIRNMARICPGGFVVRGLTVGAIANDATDYGLPVYANDDGTYSITKTAASHQVGYIIADDRRSTGTANVLMNNVLGLIGS